MCSFSVKKLFFKEQNNPWKEVYCLKISGTSFVCHGSVSEIVIYPHLPLHHTITHWTYQSNESDVNIGQSWSDHPAFFDNSAIDFKQIITPFLPYFICWRCCNLAGGEGNSVISSPYMKMLKMLTVGPHCVKSLSRLVLSRALIIEALSTSGRIMVMCLLFTQM